MAATNANGTATTHPSIKRNQSFTELLGDNLTFDVKTEYFEHAHVKTIDQYRALHKESVENPESFWTKIADKFYWKEKWSGKFMDYNFDIRKGDIFIKFMEGGKTNICYNVLDRIVKDTPDKVAFFW